MEHFFGPMKLAYSLKRPDGGKVTLKTLDDAVTVLRQHRPSTRGEGQVFASAIDGTIVTAVVTAFPKLTEGWDENSLIAYMNSQSSGSEEKQWFKEGQGAHLRPILVPLIAYYTQYLFQLILKDRFQ